MRRYTNEERAYLRDIIPGCSRCEVVALANARFTESVTFDQVVAFIKNNHVATGRTGRFEKGHASWSKGTKGVLHSNVTSFSKGDVPANRVPIGTEKVRVDGYVYVKIADGFKNANWLQKHILVWEQANGPLPADHVLIFANGDREDVRLDNLVLAERADLAVMNKRSLMGRDSQSMEAGVLTSRLIRRACARRVPVTA